MYDFIYYYFYMLASKRNPDPKLIAAEFVFFVLVVHIGLLFTIIEVFFNLSYISFSDSYLINKLYMMPFAIAFLILVYYIFKRRFDKIERKYEWRNMLTFWNTVIVFSIMLIPIFAVILLLK